MIRKLKIKFFNHKLVIHSNFLLNFNSATNVFNMKSLFESRDHIAFARYEKPNRHFEIHEYNLFA